MSDTIKAVIFLVALLIGLPLLILWLRDRFGQKCRTCNVDGIEGALLDRFPTLKPVEPLKFGYLYQCSKCGRPWFLYEHKVWLDRI